MQGILRKHSPTTEAADVLLGLKSTRSSPQKIRVKSHISTKINAGTEGKLGKMVGKTENHMFILEIEGKQHKFFRKDLDIADEPKSNPKRQSPKRSSPNSVIAEELANNFIDSLKPGIADKVINAICKRRTSKKKSPRTSPKRTSPKERRSVKVCKDDEEPSVKTGRCIKKCKPDQVRTKENRCRKIRSRKPKTEVPRPRIPSPLVPTRHPKVTDEDMVIEGNSSDDSSDDDASTIADEPIVEERVRLRRSPPRSPPRFVEDTDPVTQFITEDVDSGPFVSGDDDSDMLVE